MTAQERTVIMSVLTVYFSLKGETITPQMTVEILEKGHTAVMAEFIQEAVGSELFEIETVKEYIKDHMKMIYEANDELTQESRPAPQIFTKVKNALKQRYRCTSTRSYSQIPVR